MTKYKITLKSVYSCPAEEVPDGVNLPENWTLSWHQVKTLKAIRDPNIDVIFNTAMTGDGKSLAAYLETLQNEQFSVIGLYPTNELARDQEDQIKNYIDLFQPKGRPRVARLSSEDLEIYAENENFRKSDALSTITGQKEILMTNPDIFHYLHRGAYLLPKDNPDKLWGRIDQIFDLFIFDEFHIFNAPQIASVINTLLLIKNTKRNKKFLFLSATPNEQLIKRLTIAGFNCQEINPSQEGKYIFPETLKELEQIESSNWRKVSSKIDLNFIGLELTSKALEVWLQENSQMILDYFLESPGTKGAIILNSIAAVKRLTPFFSKLFKRHGLEVGENTGLSGRGEKARSLSADLVLGTSTIDVGVDFKINFLIFESLDAGSFIQRLGRLGRHDEYEKNGQKVRFRKFTAYSLAPNFLVGRLFLEDGAPLKIGNIYDREFFNQQIRQCYWKLNDFPRYYSRWGSIQSFDLASKNGLGNPKLTYKEDGSQEAFKNTCEKVFDTKFVRVYGCLKKWQQEWREFSGSNGNPIADEAVSFRGSSSLQCGLLDLTEINEADRFKTYDLPGILSNLDIEIISEAEFRRLLEKTVTNLKHPIAKGRFNYCLAFMRLNSYREERLNWRFSYPGENLQIVAESWKVQVLQGVQVWQPENCWISEINKRLLTKPLVSFVVRCPAMEIRKRLRLPMQFQLYPIDEAGSRNRDASYSVAFGQSALMLETVTYRLKNTGGESWIC
jgi:CRISPR-associated endonuclease/helicase Cas3